MRSFAEQQFRARSSKGLYVRVVLRWENRRLVFGIEIIVAQQLAYRLQHDRD